MMATVCVVSLLWASFWGRDELGTDVALTVVVVLPVWGRRWFFGGLPGIGGGAWHHGTTICPPPSREGVSPMLLACSRPSHGCRCCAVSCVLLVLSRFFFAH
uniref:Predicted protein n=1 Tax=Hordeum vulgare subsp. vulgare TaxID=112509 RepID=F2EJP0_HORVV|nr:predicted protein [Hordeum vulgare subsp. vulgare]